MASEADAAERDEHDMTRRLPLMELVFASAVAAGPASAITAPERAEVLVRLHEVVGTKLALTERRAAILARLADGEKTGRYATDDEGSFASRVTADLFTASGDRHLYLKFDPALATALSRRIGQSAPPPASQVDIAARYARRNQGYVEQRVLEGNVRYLNISSFDWNPTATPQVADAAARFLSAGDAIIVDLRNNAGGEPPAVVYLLSYFAKPDELLVTFQTGTSAREIRAAGDLPAPRITGKRVYVLTSATTASAAEEFAYFVTSRKIGETIGSRTSGAGNVKEDYAAAHGFVISASSARAIDAVTKSNWEGVGVAPTMAATKGEALEVAHLRALQALAASGAPGQRRAIELALRVARARTKPVVLTADDLARYSGVYGERHILVRDGALVGQVPEQPDIMFTPLGEDWFRIDGSNAQVHFLVAGGHATALQLSRAEGDGEPIPLVSP